MSDKKNYLFEIDVIHKVSASYRVEAESHDAAIRALCDIGLFSEYASGTFGPCEYVMEQHGIELVCAWAHGDPSPAGTQRVSRDWDVHEVEECALDAEAA